MKRSSVMVALLLSCRSASTPSPPPAASASASSSASAPASAPASPSAPASASASATPPLPSLTPHSYTSLCPDLAAALVADADAGPGRPPTATDLMVSAKMRTVKNDFVASIAVPAKRVDREVFRMGAAGDPFQCCSRAIGDALDVTCNFSGIDIIEAHARASVEGDSVVIRWCKADLSTGSRINQGEERVKTGGAHVWFGASTPACAPKMPQ